MDREHLDNWCEKGILALVLSILVFGPLATGAVRPLEFLIIQSLTLGVLFLWILRIWIKPKYLLFWPPVCWGVVAFMLYAVGRYSFADLEYISRQEMIKVLIYGFLFLAIVNNLNRQESTQIISITLIFLASAVALYAIYQFATHSEKVWHFTRPHQYAGRGSGTYICPDHAAGFLEMILPIGLIYTLIGRFSYAFKVVLAYLCGLILIGIGVTISRGGWAATSLSLVAGLVFLILTKKLRWPALIFIVGFFALGLGFALNSKHAAKRFGEVSADDNRFKYWGMAVQVWKEDPWIGAGPDHYDHRYRLYRSRGETHYRPLYAHNDYLQVLSDYGNVGFAIISSAWLLFFWGLAKTWRFVQRNPNDLVEKKSNKAAFVLGGSLGLLAILIHSVVDFHFHIPANAILAVTLMALVAGYQRFATERFWIRSPAMLKILVTLILVSGVVYLFTQELRRAGEFRWMEKEETATTFAEQTQYVSRALEIEPNNVTNIYLLGELYRAKSWEGNADYADLAKTAMSYFERAARLDSRDPYPPARYGMCLDWLGKSDEADPYFERAVKLDPNGYYIVALRGWHYLHKGDLLEAKKWLEESLAIRDNWNNFNPVATFYLGIVNRKLAEKPPPGALKTVP